MCPGEGGGSAAGSGSGTGSGIGTGSGGPDIGAILDYLRRRSFGTDGDYTGNAGYGGDNIGPVGSKEPEKDEDEAAALIDPIKAVPRQTFQPMSRQAGDNGHWRKIEPYTGAQASKESLFAFVGQDVDPYSGVTLGREGLDPFTGTQITDPFTVPESPRRAERTVSFTAIRRNGLLSSPNLIASNGPIAPDSKPNKKNDFMTEKELEEHNAFVEDLAAGRERIVGQHEDMSAAISERIAAAITTLKTDEWNRSYQLNRLSSYPLEVHHSAVSAGLGHMASGGFLVGTSGLTIWLSGGAATPLVTTMGLGTGIAQFFSGLTLVARGGSSTEVVRMSSQLDQAFAFSSSPASLLFGTTGLVLSKGDADIAHRFALAGGLAEGLIKFPYDPSKLYAAVLPEAAITAQKVAMAQTLKNAVALEKTVVAGKGAAAPLIKNMTGQSGLINPRPGEELFVGEWLNRNLQANLDNTAKSFVADPRAMATLVPPNIPYRAIPQYGGFVMEYGGKASVESNWILNSIVQGVPQSSQMVRGGAADMMLRAQFAGWNLKGWDFTTALSASAKQARGVDYTFLTYTVDWKALRVRLMP